MSALSMKNRRSRNMMSIIGIRLGETSSSALIVLKPMFPPSRRLGVETGVLEHLDRHQVGVERELRDAVLHEEEYGQEDDREEETHRGIDERLVKADGEVGRRRGRLRLDDLEGRDHARHGSEETEEGGHVSDQREVRDL